MPILDKDCSELRASSIRDIYPGLYQFMDEHTDRWGYRWAGWPDTKLVVGFKKGVKRMSMIVADVRYGGFVTPQEEIRAEVLSCV